MLNEKLRELGYNDWYVDLDLSDCFAHFAYLRDRSLPEKDKFLGLIVVQRRQPSFAHKSQFVRENLIVDLLGFFSFK